MADFKEMTVSCLCTAATPTFTVPISSFLLPSNLCNYTTSPRICGSLLTSYINITHATSASTVPQKPNLTALTAYRGSSILMRWFCSTCGTQMYLEYATDGHFEAATGTLRLEHDDTNAIVEYHSYTWIEDTKDGGASQFISQINDKLLKRFRRETSTDSQVPFDWKSEALSGTAYSGMRDKGTAVHATYHCRGVQFYIKYPDELSKNASSNYPDLMIPYRLEPDASVNPENRSWWLADKAIDRYLAGTCACVTCRRSSGFDITFWAFIPTINIFLDAACCIIFTRGDVDQAGGRKEGARYWGSMKTYRSSKNVTRPFCGKCGTSIFWGGDERSSLIDVAAGLLNAESGTRAEESLAWCPERVSFEEKAMNRELIMGLRKGLRKWSDRNKGVGYVTVSDLSTRK